MTAVRHKHYAEAADGPSDGRVQPSWFNEDHEIGPFLEAIIGLSPTARTVLTFDGTGAALLAAISDDVRAALSGTAAQFAQSLGLAPINSPGFLGSPTAVTPPVGADANRIATMGAITTAIAQLINSAPTTLDTLGEIATALGNNANAVNDILSALGYRVRFDAAQALTSGQKNQALANLGITIGTAANNVLQLDANAKIPPVDGSQLLNLPSGLSYLTAQTLNAANREQLRANAVTLAGGDFVGFYGNRASGSPNNLWQISYVAVELFGANGKTVVVRNGTKTVDFNVSSVAGGVVGGSSSRVAGNGYDIWLWFNETTEDVGVTSSQSSVYANNPPIPAGYTYKRRVGWIALDGSANILDTYQRGKKSSYATPRAIASGTSAYTTIGLTNIVPSTAMTVSGSGLLNNNSVSIGDTSGTTIAGGTPAGGGGAYYVNFSFLLLSMAMYYGSSSGGGALNIGTWEDNI